MDETVQFRAGRTGFSLTRMHDHSKELLIISVPTLYLFAATTTARKTSFQNITSRFRTLSRLFQGDYNKDRGLWTVDCGLRTAEPHCGLGLEHGLGTKRGLRTKLVFLIVCMESCACVSKCLYGGLVLVFLSVCMESCACVSKCLYGGLVLVFLSVCMLGRIQDFLMGGG